MAFRSVTFQSLPWPFIVEGVAMAVAAIVAWCLAGWFIQ